MTKKPNPRTPKMDARSVVARCRRVMDLYSDMDGVVLPHSAISVVLPIADVERLCSLALAPKRETSDRASRAAAKLMAMKGGTFCWWAPEPRAGLNTARNVTSLVRSVAGSALAQDQTPGKRAKRKAVKRG